MTTLHEQFKSLPDPLSKRVFRAVMAWNGNFTATEVAKHLGAPPVSVATALNKLWLSGSIDRVQRAQSSNANIWRRAESVKQ